MSVLEISGTVIRELTKEEAGSKKPLGSKPSPLKKIRDSHHALAMLIAEGNKDVDVARMTGYDPARISVLKQDPAFKELITHYIENKQQAQMTVHARFAQLSMDAAETLQARLDEDPDSLSSEELMDLMKLTADRTGFGPSTKNTNVNVNVNLGDRLSVARQRVTEVEARRLLPPPREIDNAG